MRAALPLPLINMVSVLCRIEQPRLRWNVGRAALLLNRANLRITGHVGVDRTIAEVQRQELGFARVARLRESLAVATRDPGEAATQWLVRMSQLSKPPQRSQLFG